MTTRTLHQLSVLSPAALATLALLLLHSTYSWAASPAGAIHNHEYRRMQELTTISSDWSATTLYDLSRSLGFDATIVAIERREGLGYMELLYTLNIPAEQRHKASFDTQKTYFAILQTPETVGRLSLPTRELSRGVQVRLVGWPKVQENGLKPMMLIDSITLKSSGVRYGLHDGNVKLKTRESRLKAARTQRGSRD